MRVGGSTADPRRQARLPRLARAGDAGGRRGIPGPAAGAVAARALPDGTLVIVSGGGHGGGTVRVWRLADGALAAPSLELPGSVQSVAVHGKDIVTAARADTAVHQLALP
jgi:hypothetical protein